MYELYFEIIGEGVLSTIMIVTGAIFALWIKPFMMKKSTAYFTGALYSTITIILYFMPLEIDSEIARWTVIICCFALMYCLERRNPEQKIFLCIVFNVIRWLVAGLFSETNFFLTNYSSKIKLFRENVTAIMVLFAFQELLWASGIIVFSIFAFKTIHKIYKRKYENMSVKELILMLVPVMVSIFVKPLIMDYYDLWSAGIEHGIIQENIPPSGYRAGFYLVAYATIIVCIYFYQDIKNRQEEMYSRAMLERQIKNNREYVERVNGLYDEMRAFRHDIGNHIVTLNQLIEKGYEREASEYVKKIQGQLAVVTPQDKTGNGVTDVILSDYRKRAEAKKIEFTSTFNFPDGTNVSAFDISIILNNALDNALEAATGQENPRIELMSFRKKNFYVIEIRNTIVKPIYIPENEAVLATTKAGDGHGFGLKNIRAVAKSYQGDIDIYQETDETGRRWFILDVMLQL